MRAASKKLYILFALAALALFLAFPGEATRAQVDQRSSTRPLNAADRGKLSDGLRAFVKARRSDVEKPAAMTERDLLVVKRDAAKLQLDTLHSLWETSGGMETVASLMEASRILMESEVALADKKADRVTAIKTYVNRVRTYASIVEQRLQLDAGPDALAKASYWLADAEHRLLVAEKQ